MRLYLLFELLDANETLKYTYKAQKLNFKGCYQTK